MGDGNVFVEIGEDIIDQLPETYRQREIHAEAMGYTLRQGGEIGRIAGRIVSYAQEQKLSAREVTFFYQRLAFVSPSLFPDVRKVAVAFLEQIKSTGLFDEDILRLNEREVYAYYGYHISVEQSAAKLQIENFVRSSVSRLLGEDEKEPVGEEIEAVDGPLSDSVVFLVDDGDVTGFLPANKALLEKHGAEVVVIQVTQHDELGLITGKINTHPAGERQKLLLTDLDLKNRRFDGSVLADECGIPALIQTGDPINAENYKGDAPILVKSRDMDKIVPGLVSLKIA